MELLLPAFAGLASTGTACSRKLASVATTVIVSILPVGPKSLRSHWAVVGPVARMRNRHFLSLTVIRGGLAPLSIHLSPPAALTISVLPAASVAQNLFSVRIKGMSVTP